MIEVHHDRLRLREVFTISRGSRTHAEVLRVTVTREDVTGQGECVPYAHYGESMDSVEAQIRSLPREIWRDELQDALPPGAARNALDCALWDWEAKHSGTPVWQLAGLAEPGPVRSAYTLSLASPAEMRAQAERHRDRPLLKVKLGGGPEDRARIEAVRAGAPGTKIIVDANEGWTVAEYQGLAPVFHDLGVEMVEQPLPDGRDGRLRGLDRVLPICADESCHDRSSLPALRGKYDFVNIKLDKTGGLTEALALRDAAMAEGYRIMVGCMIGSSLAMAPALLVAQGAEIADLDGPLLLAEDRDPPMQFDAEGAHPADPALWG